MNLDALVQALRASRGFAHKRDIAGALATLTGGAAGRDRPVVAMTGAPQGVALGDDCAAIPDGDGFLLFAIEGFVEDFVQTMPWFAGYCGVMVNASDIAAMGGRAIAVVDAVWGRGDEAAQPVLEGLAAAAERYRIPVVGGHSNLRASSGQLAVAIVGRATKLLTSFDAKPGDALVMAVDLRGEFMEPNPFWNASTAAPAERLRADLELLPQLAEAGLAHAAKDISMAGTLGTVLMLIEASRAGAAIDLAAVPRPAGVALERWLQAFPSYGFVLATGPANVDAVRARFAARGIAAARIGHVEAGSQLWLHAGDARALLWDHGTEAFVGV